MPAVASGLEIAGKQRADFALSAQVIGYRLSEEQYQAADLFRPQPDRLLCVHAGLPTRARDPVGRPQSSQLSRGVIGPWRPGCDAAAHFAVVGEPGDVAAQVRERFAGRVERVGPVIYRPTWSCGTLLAALRRSRDLLVGAALVVILTLGRRDAVIRHPRERLHSRRFPRPEQFRSAPPLSGTAPTAPGLVRRSARAYRPPNDAYSFGVRYAGRAYRYAFGEPIKLPLDQDSRGT